jgi:hypothetical protein
MEAGPRGMSDILAFQDYRPAKGQTAQPLQAVANVAAPPPVFFDRREFAQILDLYSRMVGRGEWRDYAIGHDKDSCCFAVFRRSADGALYRIVKTPKLARRQGAFAILGQGGRILRRGRELAMLLRYFEPKRDALA